MGRGQNVGLNIDFYHILTLLPPGTSVLHKHIFCLSLSLLVFYVTCDDISVIYMTAQMYRRTEEEVDVVPTVGLPRHRHFVGFFNVPVLHRHGTNLFIRWFRHTAPLVAFYDTLGIRRTYSRLKPPAPFCQIMSGFTKNMMCEAENLESNADRGGGGFSVNSTWNDCHIMIRNK